MIIKSSIPREDISLVSQGKKELCGKERDGVMRGMKAMSSNKICLVFVVSYFPLTHRPLGVKGGMSTLSRTVWVGGGIISNFILSKTLEDSANPGMPNNGLCFHIFFSLFWLLPSRLSGFCACNVLINF